MRVSRRALLGRLGAAAIAGSTPLASFGFAKAPLPVTAATALGHPILLDRNENAYGPSERVLAALRDASTFGNRYARAEYDSLIAKIAGIHSVKLERIALACGSSEILRLAAAEFLGPGKKLVQASPTFPLLGRVARSAGMEVIDVPLRETGEHDLEAMLRSVRDSAGLVYICNPNNPTGTLTPRREIEDFLQKLPAKTMVLIDEAYHHFVGNDVPSYASFLDHPVDDSRVMVARTFSKIYGLAGMRLGYVSAAPEITRKFSAHQGYLGISIVAVRAAGIALDDVDYVKMGVKRNADDRQEFFNQVNGRMIHALNSHTNFVLINPLRTADKVIEHLKNNNVLIAPPIPAMSKYVRVSLGTPSDMLEFWKVLDQLPVTEKTHM
jgi:histidinol-phosphate aminotransferase